jgi:hypothetical protein
MKYSIYLLFLSLNYYFGIYDSKQFEDRNGNGIYVSITNKDAMPGITEAFQEKGWLISENRTSYKNLGYSKNFCNSSFNKFKSYWEIYYNGNLDYEMIRLIEDHSCDVLFIHTINFWLLITIAIIIFIFLSGSLIYFIMSMVKKCIKRRKKKEEHHYDPFNQYQGYP